MQDLAPEQGQRAHIGPLPRQNQSTLDEMQGPLAPIFRGLCACCFQIGPGRTTILSPVEMLQRLPLEQQKKAWLEKEAYVTDAYRLVFNRQLCLQCHQVGTFEPKNDILGPNLGNAHKRLRPGWLERWIANPQRFLTYTTSMPMNFPADKKTQFQEFFAGEPIERVQAVRDMLMIFPHAEAMPVNRYWALPLPGEKK